MRANKKTIKIIRNKNQWKNAVFFCFILNNFNSYPCSISIFIFYIFVLMVWRLPRGMAVGCLPSSNYSGNRREVSLSFLFCHFCFAFLPLSFTSSSTVDSQSYSLDWTFSRFSPRCCCEPLGVVSTARHLLSSFSLPFFSLSRCLSLFPCPSLFPLVTVTRHSHCSYRVNTHFGQGSQNFLMFT